MSSSHWTNQFKRVAGGIVNQPPDFQPLSSADGVDGLKFEIADTPEEQVKLMVQSLPTDTGANEVNARAQEILSSPISAAAGVDNDSVMEPAPASDDAGAGIVSPQTKNQQHD